eukprot:3115424-Amphidinium_carterae.1
MAYTSGPRASRMRTLLLVIQTATETAVASLFVPECCVMSDGFWTQRRKFAAQLKHHARVSLWHVR